MSKFKVNQKVIVKANGKVGRIKSKDVIENNDGTVKVEYIVKFDNGFDNWSSFSKDEIEKIPPKTMEKKYQKLIVTAPNGYKITMVGICRKADVPQVKKEPFGGMLYTDFGKGTELRIGFSICNPEDKFNEEFGIDLAMHRLKVKPFCHLFSQFKGEFNKETIDALLKVKADYVINNLEHFTKTNYFAKKTKQIKPFPF